VKKSLENGVEQETKKVLFREFSINTLQKRKEKQTFLLFPLLSVGCVAS
jgi:nitrate reductase NapE component